MSAVHVDLSDLTRLSRDLNAAATKAPVRSQRELRAATVEVHGGAVRNASAFNQASTGELASSVDFDVVGDTGRVYTDVRQGWFLEAGTPKTGAPRPWLTAPAEQGWRSLHDAMGDVGAVW